MPATVTGPFESDWKADHPIYKVIVVTSNGADTFVDHKTWEARDGSASGKADALDQAQTYADQVRRQQ